MKLDAVFRAEYKKLNPEQKKAVDAIEGPVMVIAGPGTGKTKILTLRIANILRKTDVEPNNILALTFTESGAYSMRKNLVSIIGSAAYRVTISTFHGFCNQIIKDYPEYFEHIIGSKHIALPQQIELVEEILTHNTFKVIKPTGNIYYYVYPLLKKISDLKKDAVSVQVLKKRITEEKNSLEQEFSDKKNKNTSYITKQKALERNKELLKVYEIYQKLLRERNLYDYDDMIVEVLSVLSRNNDLLLTLQEQYQYILADEHQDANQAQNNLLELLASFHAPYPNLFIVGDEKQAIFRFQGASLENFLYFQKIFPKALLVNLFVNYRSTQKILDAAHSVILKSDGGHNPLRKRLISHTKKAPSPVSVLEFTHQKFEEHFLVRKTEELIKKGTEPGEIAILYRDNKDAFAIARLFEKTNIPFVIESEENILDDIDIRKLITLLFAIYYFGEDEYLVPALHISFLGIDEFDIYKLSQFARSSKEKIHSILASKKLLKKAKVKHSTDVEVLFQNLKRWKSLSHNKSFLFFLETVVHESGFLKNILSLPDATQKIGKLTDLYTYIGEIEKGHDTYSLEQFILYIELQRRYGLNINKKKDPVLVNAVRLMTAHRSKGLEFKTVFIVYAQDKHWGGRKDRELFSIHHKKTNTQDTLLDDERRLFYVALTRAKYDVYITYAKEGLDGKQRLPSQFIEEIDDSFKKKVSTKKTEENLKNDSPFYVQKRKGRQLPVQNKEYLNSLFLEQGLSVTALNNYLACPWKYFYVNLIRIPSVQTHPQMYGIAIHAALEVFFSSYKLNKHPTKKILIRTFEKKLNTFSLPEDLCEQLLEKGRRALSGYYDTYKSTWNKNIITEFAIRGIALDKNITLNGKLDKIEFLDEGGVVVVDYKTGKPKSRNEILGKTKTSTGDYIRQIVFYKLLLDLLQDKKYEFQRGEIDFVEPNEKGNYKKESFTVIDEDVEKLKNQIKDVSQEILDLSFFGETCADKKCEYCFLQTHLQ